MAITTYTLSEKGTRQHRLVKAAKQKGLTGIKITHYEKKSSAYFEGWYLQADQQPHQLHLGYSMKESEERISRI
jgi:hypothetical protein